MNLKWINTDVGWQRRRDGQTSKPTRNPTSQNYSLILSHGRKGLLISAHTNYRDTMLMPIIITSLSNKIMTSVFSLMLCIFIGFGVLLITLLAIINIRLNPFESVILQPSVIRRNIFIVLQLMNQFGKLPHATLMLDTRACDSPYSPAISTRYTWKQAYPEQHEYVRRS